VQWGEHLGIGFLKALHVNDDGLYHFKSIWAHIETMCFSKGKMNGFVIIRTMN
jgi:hypothetical protein